jgi:hypothetical protein
MTVWCFVRSSNPHIIVSHPASLVATFFVPSDPGGPFLCPIFEDEDDGIKEKHWFP